MSTVQESFRVVRIACDVLERLGYDNWVDEVQVLSGGVSGAVTMLLTMPAGEAVLKLADENASQEQRSRAERELSFYRELAPHVPMRVPEMLAGDGDGAGGNALLLRSHARPRSLAELTEAEMEMLVAQLVALHVAFWGQTDLPERYPWLRPVPVPSDAADFAHAMAAWKRQSLRETLDGAITRETLAALPDWFAVLRRAEARLADYPVTLVHGDCHLGNVLWASDGAPVWSDWQEVGLGYGPRDMSFVLQRACSVGDNDLYDLWAARYAELLSELAPDHPDVALTLQVMDAHELSLRLIEWPHCFGWQTHESVAYQIQRLAAAAERLARAH